MLLANKRILMFEDNIENITVQQTILRDEGAEVHMFIGGLIEDVVNLLPLNLIIMDLMIPGGMDGFDFFTAIRQSPDLADIPVVAVSAMDPSLAVSKAKSMGFAGFIAKPVDIDTFPQHIASIIEGKSVWKTQ